MRIFFFFLHSFVLGFLLTSCQNSQEREHQYLIYGPQFSELSFQSEEKKSFYSNHSTPAGNLIATAFRRVHNLDVVLYPRALLVNEKIKLLHPNLGPDEIEALVDFFPEGSQDSFLIGTMRGDHIKNLILRRSQLKYSIDLEVAGLHYHCHFIGGLPQFSFFQRSNGLPFKDDEIYKIGISNYFFFSSQSFPGYRFGNGLSFSFTQAERDLSARDALREYLRNTRDFPNLNRKRAYVTRGERGKAGSRSITEIQGHGFRSPFYGQKVTTQGIVTAVGDVEWYPGGIDVYIQDPNPPASRTSAQKYSKGLKLHFRNENKRFNLGDKILVTGIVYEHLSATGLGVTSIREIESVKVIETNVELPKAILLGQQGRPIPDKQISKTRGNLLRKPILDLRDGIDFWESLEGMRVRIKNPRIVGFSGGQQDFEFQRPRGYLSIYVVADGFLPHPRQTPTGGLLIDEKRGYYNPQIIQISTNHLTYNLDNQRYLKVGDVIEGSIEGVLAYEQNLFGDGEYVLVLPERQEDLDRYLKSLPTVGPELTELPQSQLFPEENKLTIATFNVENLSGHQTRRLKRFGQSIAINLKCPDIMVLVEVQDFNGVDFLGGADAELTLQGLIDHIPCSDANYVSLNINPILHGEGGQPGGNIRVALIYNKKRLGFIARPLKNIYHETSLLTGGQLSSNPGRLFSNDRTFHRTRRPIIADFNFRGERIIVIGNHLNSKIADPSLWSVEQPVIRHTDNRRFQMTTKLNRFVQNLLRLDPKAHVVMIGDFNAFVHDSSMRALEGNILYNLYTVPGLVQPNERYSTSHNGNSQILDHILVNENLLQRNPELEVINMNSDFMGRLSDHDPVLSRFQFD